MKVGDRVKVLTGTSAFLKSRGLVADYMTENIDGMTGTITEDFTCVIGIPEQWLVLCDEEV